MQWADIIGEIRAFDEHARKDASVAWYRGHADSRWSLKSTLHRWLERYAMGFVTPPSGAGMQQLLRDEYKKLYRRFKSDAWPLLDARERSDWGVIFAMQHYGQPTRLLDWTESFACAVYFAQFHRSRDVEAAIWALDPQALNKITAATDALVALDEDVLPSTFDAREWHPRWLGSAASLRTIAVSPLFTNPRMTAQRSAFTLSGDSFDPLDIELQVLVDKRSLRKFVLPPDTFDGAEEFLRSAGLDAFSFFPDLHGLALRHEAQSQERMRDAARFYPRAYKLR